jgi:hypothetical protein
MSATDEAVTDPGGGITGDVAAGAPEGGNVLRNVAFAWGAALVFLVFTYIGVTNTDFSPTILGELNFGTLAVLLFFWGLAMLLNR